MTADLRKTFNAVLRQLTEDGFLLLFDSSVRSVTTIVTKQKIKGSWWTHEDASTIFAVSQMLEDHPDVLIAKLISKKVTFIHRDLWSRVYSIGVARDDWQMKSLSTEAIKLLKMVDRTGFLETSKLGKSSGAKPGDTARELEGRLLLNSHQVHTSSGAHAKVLETWNAWAKRVGFTVRAKDSAAARQYLEQRLGSIDKTGLAKLPWQRK